jgi:hypothetical protein
MIPALTAPAGEVPLWVELPREVAFAVSLNAVITMLLDEPAEV